jgi:hypothetical protein
VIDKEVEPALVRIGEEKVYETSLGANVEIPIKLVRREDFKDAVKLTAVGLTQQMRPKDVTLSPENGEAKFELALNHQNIRPGSYTFYMKGESKRKYARNPDAVASAEAEQKRLMEMIKAIEDEIKSATEAKNDAALTGRKIFSGLKMVMTLRRISMKRTPSGPSLIFDLPWRGAASTGSNQTL